MLEGQRDSCRSHDFLGKRLLAPRPAKHINHHAVAFVSFPIHGTRVVIQGFLRLGLAQLDSRLDHFLPSETQLVSTGASRSEENIIHKLQSNTDIVKVCLSHILNDMHPIFHIEYT